MKSNGRQLILGLISKAFVVLLLVGATNVSASGDNLEDQTQFYAESQNFVNAYEQTAPIPLEWESECIGVVTYPTSGLPTAISYVYTCTLHIDDFLENDTNIKGTVEFRFYEPGKGCGCSQMRCVLTSEFIGDYICSAKAAFTGTLTDYFKIIMEIKGDSISGRFPQDFSPVLFVGVLDDDWTKIKWGEGFWFTYFKSKYEIPKDEEWDSGFTIGINNNSFNNHFNDFFKTGEPQTHKIYTSAILDKLKNNCKNYTEFDFVKKDFETSVFGGDCFGISATMAFVFKEKLDNYALINEGNENKKKYLYHELPKPVDNIYFRDVLHYYHRSKILQRTVELKEYYTLGDYPYYSGKLVSPKTFLSNLVKDTKEAASDNRVLMIDYKASGAKSGHVILITKYIFFKKENRYELTLYDMNGFKNCTMKISGDFSEFSFIDGKNNKITEHDFEYLYCYKPEKIFDAVSHVSNVSRINTQNNTENYTFICFSSDSSFKLTSDIGLSLTYENNEFSGDLPVFSLDYIDNDVKIKTAYCSSYKIEPISKDIDINIYDNDHFKAVVGNNIESIDISVPGDMKLKGDAYTFKAYASVEEMLDEKESGMGSIFAKGKGEVVVHPGQNTVEATSKKHMSGIETAVYQGVDVIEGTIKGNQKKVVLKVTEDPDNHNLEEGGMIIFAKSGYAYKGRPIKPFVSVYVGGKSLKKNKEFKVQYEDNVEVGTGKLTVTGVGEYSGTLTAEFPIVPKKVKMKKLIKCKSGFKVSWKSSGPRDGFEIQYATDPDFIKPTIMKIDDSESFSAQVDGLEVGTEYFVRIRAYKNETGTGKTYNSTWSDVKSVLIYPY